MVEGNFAVGFLKLNNDVNLKKLLFGSKKVFLQTNTYGTRFRPDRMITMNNCKKKVF